MSLYRPITTQFLRQSMNYPKYSRIRPHSPKRLSQKRRISVASPTRAVYEYIENVEDISYYEPGGFHPVCIGDCFNQRYRVVNKLGYGGYSTIWLARDLQLKKYVALKIAVSSQNNRESDAISIFADKENRHFPSIFDRFNINGPNGKHQCIIMEAARCSLAASKEASDIRLFPLPVARALAAQLTLAVDSVHNAGYVHGDLHLGNILLKLPHTMDLLSEEQLKDEFGPPIAQDIVRQDKVGLTANVPPRAYELMWMGIPTEDVTFGDANIILTDFGVAFRPSEQNILQSHTPVDIRPPEARFEPNVPLTFASDIWSLACTIWNFLAQRPIFGEILATPDIITSQQINTLGQLPQHWWDKWDSKFKFFTSDGVPIEDQRSPTWEQRFQGDIQEPRQESNLGRLEAKEADAFAVMIKQMLAYEATARPTTKEILDTE